MNPFGYLISGSIAFFTFGGWNLVQATRYAPEGFEDDLGFHLGVTPQLGSLYPRLASSTFSPANQARASVPKTPKRRQIRGSKPPMLPPEMSVQDLNPSSPDKSQQKSPSHSQDPQAGQTQIPFPSSGNKDDLN
jgi:hypothetical protein